MNRFIASSCLLCLWLAISLQSGGSIFANANNVRRLSSEQQQKGLPSYRPPNSNSNIDHITITLTNMTATNTTNATASVAPTPARVPSTPTPPPTPYPTKKYEPPPDDNEEGEVEKEATKIGWVFLYIVIIFAFIWVIIYFRDAIGFFLTNAWNNTRRYGCKGCLHSFFPCFFGSLSRGGSQPLDQIIFETDDHDTPLMT